jgi:hypothetical protein
MTTMSTRRGSFLLVCIGMMALMVLIGFAMLRSLRVQTDTSTANQRVLLAQAAAQAGLAHATEQILRAYASPTVMVGSDAAGASNGQEQLPALTFIHGPHRAAFMPLKGGDNPQYDFNEPDADNDVRTEHHLVRPWVIWNWSDYYYEWCAVTNMSGRARYYEPNYYNVTQNPAPKQPVVPTGFFDPNAAAPERDLGMFYDDQFRRLEKSDPAEARRLARYRLRYAVDVDDLSGHLLINPMADMKLPDDYRTPPNWMARAGDALASMMTAQTGGLNQNDPWAGAHCEHTFLGRGWCGNNDIDDKGFPLTFPLMYRNADGGNDNLQWESFTAWWGWRRLAYYLYQNQFTQGKKDGGESLYINGAGDDRCYTHALMGPQMSWWNYHYATTEDRRDMYWDNWGGTLNPNTTLLASTPFGRALRQPTGYPQSYHPQKRKWYEGRVNTPFYVNILTAPPWVVNAMLVSYLPPKYKIYKYTWISFVWYKGRTVDGWDDWDWDHPVGMPIDGFNPKNNSSQYGRDLLVDTTTPAFAEFPAPYRDATTNPPIQSAGDGVIKPDYYVDDPRLPHQELDAQRQPMTDGNGNPIMVDQYQQIYPGIAWNGDPDKLGEGTDDAGAAMNSDDLGYGLCTHTRQPFVRLDPSPPMGEVDWDGNWQNETDQGWQNGDPTVSPPDSPPSGNVAQTDGPWRLNARNRWYKSPDPKRLKFQDSYWWDIYCAMAMGISVFRAQWHQYDGGYMEWYQQRYNPEDLFPPGERDPSRYRTIRDLDRQFLSELGESLDSPGTAWPADLDAQNKIHAYCLHGNPPNWTPWLIPPIWVHWIPNNNIKSALDQDLLKSGNPDGTKKDANGNPLPVSGMTSADRAKVSELVLNDIRMAFFGSSPEYSDGIDPVTGAPDPAQEFRPLDFDGDGEVYCSAYQDPNAPTPANQDNTAPRTTPLPHRHVEANGRGPKPDPSMYFAPTGCFFTGKSHYYRVVTRGELWDNLYKSILNEASLESVLCVDPEGTNVKDTHTIFQRWDFDKYLGQTSHIKP